MPKVMGMVVKIVHLVILFSFIIAKVLMMMAWGLSRRGM